MSLSLGFRSTGNSIISLQFKKLWLHNNAVIIFIIKGQEALSGYQDVLEAYLKAQGNICEFGTVMIQPCMPSKEAYTLGIPTNELFVFRQRE